jgi:hypothetical protein
MESQMSRLAMTAWILFSLSSFGCQSEVETSGDEKPTVAVSAVSSESISANEAKAVESRIQHVPVDAEQLAGILGIDAYSFRFPPGGEYLCWLEINETGQSTMPSKWPSEGCTVKSEPRVTDKPLFLWWRKDSPGPDSGGTLHLSGSRGSYSYGIPHGAFTFGWTGFGGINSVPDGVSIAAGQTKILMSCFFKEGPVADGKEARTVTLLLKARMVPEATDKKSDKTQ